MSDFSGAPGTPDPNGLPAAGSPTPPGQEGGPGPGDGPSSDAGPVTGPAAAFDPATGPERHPRRGRRRRRAAEPGSASRLSRTQRRALVALALIGALAVAVTVPLVLAAQPPPGASPSPAVPTPTLPGGSVTHLVTPRPTLPGGTAPATPAGTPGSPAASSSRSLPPAGIVATRIRIPRLGIDLPIVEGDGIDAPIGKAAHYPNSGWPGGGTNIYIYGHAREGMFLALWKAEVGDIVTLDLAGGGERSYGVVRVLPKVPWDATTYLAATPYEILTLQTSTSYYATAPRFVVIAEPLK